MRPSIPSRLQTLFALLLLLALSAQARAMPVQSPYKYRSFDFYGVSVNQTMG